jgi:hypothetical protein
MRTALVQLSLDSENQDDLEEMESLEDKVRGYVCLPVA